MPYSCKETQDLLNGYIDGMLTVQENAAVETHLKNCKECAHELEALKQTAVLLKEDGIAPLPADFQEKLHQRLLQEQSIPVKTHRFSKYRAASAIAAGLLIVFVLGNRIYMQLSPNNGMEIGSITAGDMAAIENISDTATAIVPAPTPNEFAYSNNISNQKSRALQPEQATDSIPDDAKAASDTSFAGQSTAEPETETYNDAVATADLGVAQKQAAGGSAKAAQQTWMEYTVKVENPDGVYQLLASQYEFEAMYSGYMKKADDTDTDNILTAIADNFQAKIESKVLEDGDSNIIIITKN